MSNIIVFIKNIISTLRDALRSLFFEYKHNTDVRNLYIEHANKIDKIFTLHNLHSRMPDEMRQLIFEVSKEAVLYLHKDIVYFVEELKSLLYDLDFNYYMLDDLPVGEERTKICKTIYDLKIYIKIAPKREVLKIYRKHILNDGINLKQILNSLFKDVNEMDEKVKNATM